MEKSDFLKLVGANIRKARRSKSLSLRKMATQCTTDHSDIGKIERGRVNITVFTLYQLAKVLNVNPGALIDCDIAQQDCPEQLSGG